MESTCDQCNDSGCPACDWDGEIDLDSEWTIVVQPEEIDQPVIARIVG